MSAAETPGGALTRVAPRRLARDRVAAPECPADAAPVVAPGPVTAPDVRSDRLADRHVVLVELGPPAPGVLGATDVAEHFAARAAAVTVVRRATTEGAGAESDGSEGRAAGFAATCRRRVGGAVAAVACLAAVRRLDAGLVVVFLPSPTGAAAAALLARRPGVRVVAVVRGTPPAPIAPRRPGPVTRLPARIPGHLSGHLPARLLARLGRGLEVMALRAATEVATTATAPAPAVVAAGVHPEHLHLMPGGGTVPPSRGSARQARAVLGWPARRFTVVHAGPMSHRQDLATVVEAARLLAGIDVVLVGDGSQRRLLERQAWDVGTVRFHPTPGTATDLARVLAAADVLLLTDVGGTAGTDPATLGAYLTAGRPVLAAVPRASALDHELRRTGGAGLRVDPGDPVALADALVRLRAEPYRRGVMSRAAQRYARAQLGREAALHRLDLVVDAALTGGPEGTTTPGGRTVVDFQACPSSWDAGRNC